MSLPGDSKCVDRLGRLVDCHSLLGPAAYHGVHVIGNRVYWGSLYLGEVDPVTNTVVRTVLDKTTRTLTRIPITASIPSNLEPVTIVDDLVISERSGKILGRRLGNKLL